jgi:hypothetical protein
MKGDGNALMCGSFQSTFARKSVAEGAPSTDFGGKFGGKDVFTNGALLVIISKPPSADESGRLRM